ncbi:unnamed protein product [Umbelopsis vinacea]
MVSQNQVTEPIVATFQLKMSNVSDLSTQDVAVSAADDDNPFIANSDDEAHSQEGDNSDYEDTGDVESDSDVDTSHIDGIRKLSDIRFPSFVDGLDEPRIKCTRDEESRIMLERQEERLRKKNNDPLRTPQKGDGLPFSIKQLSENTPRRSDTDSERTPQKVAKRIRPENDYLTPTKTKVQNASPTRAPKYGSRPIVIPGILRSSTTPTKVRRSPRIKQNTKIVYRRYASLFFVAGINSNDNELITLEVVHRYVEILDRYFGNVCELDLIFNFHKAYFILDELLIAGELQESSKKSVLRVITQQDQFEEQEANEQRNS